MFDFDFDISGGCWHSIAEGLKNEFCGAFFSQIISKYSRSSQIRLAFFMRSDYSWDRMHVTPNSFYTIHRMISNGVRFYVDIDIKQERPDMPEAVELLNELDYYLIALYPPESNHLLSISDLLKPKICFFVARSEGSGVGCGALVTRSGYGEIKRMFVKPDQRGLGVGRRILEKLCVAAREHGFNLVRLETGVVQPEALRLYERAGFKRIGPFGEYKDDPLSVWYKLMMKRSKAEVQRTNLIARKQESKAAKLLAQGFIRFSQPSCEFFHHSNCQF